MNNDRLILVCARCISILFAPYYLPVMAFIVLLLFSYMSMWPWGYKLWLLAMVYLFTVLFPYWGIYVYRRVTGITRHALSRQEMRIIPYAMSITSYLALLWVMSSTHMPTFSRAVIAGALAVQILCALINTKIMISAHCAAAGGMVGMIMGFSLIFAFNPIGWLCLSVIISGAVCSSRLILRRHTLGEVCLGFVVGLVCGWSAVVFV